ncbi:T9SS type A sorting domain-containing protein [Hymenobacter monticola]|uniref:T9SS type A sorting domain-containing protein n=1 Tax=Hymenobacter monticola TaxID=1705399 RepID=A0ABY4B400_9BACT|nr:T9SS type A sorting domain-containing protein [Hymenobacter monticola]UOE33863.1 T9SS type A sorting domain-containing protein [Hymenobacter monticola]
MRRLPTPAAVVLALTAAAAHAQSLTNTGTPLTVEAGAVLVVPGALDNQAGATLTTGGTVQVGGDFRNAGTVVPASGKVVFAGTADQTLTPGGATLAKVEVRNTGPAGNNRVLLPTDLTVSQQLILTSGLLRTDPAATLLLPDGATLSGETTGRYVQGNLRVERANVSGSTPIDFDNSLTLSPNGNALGTVRVTRTAGLQTAGVSFDTNPANAAQKSIDRVWTVTADQAPTAAVEAPLSWLADDDNSLTFGQGQTYRVPGASAAWQALSSPANGAARSLTASTGSLGRFTVSTASAPLPVELRSFTAERRGADGLLRWATASEKNNDRFEVESSADGRTFRRIATVLGAGSSTQRHDYALPDPNLARYAADLVYYRLRQVDRDGTAAYSPVRTVQVPAETGFAAQAYPQPFVNELTLLVRTGEDGPVVVLAYDAVGRLLFTHRAALAAGTNTVPLPQAAALPTGAYMLSITQQRYHRTLKIIRE